MILQSANELEELLLLHTNTLHRISVDSLRHKPNPARWSKLEIIGHLADSAQNNIRRFISAQYEENPVIVYQQNKWVSAAGYHDQPPADVINLFCLLNLQIIRILRGMDTEAAQRIFTSEKTHTLEWLAGDYLKHLKYHLYQVLELEPFPYP